MKPLTFINTEKTLCRDLRALGLGTGDVCIVHTALGRIGWVNGGPEAIVTALKNSVGDSGVIAMTAQTNLNDPGLWVDPPVPKSTWAEIRRTMPPYDPKTTPTTGQGVVPEYFRTLPGVTRSGHPALSFTAWGKGARRLMAGHTPKADFGEASPLGKLYRADGKVLLVGVDYANCTALHLAEIRSGTVTFSRQGSPMMVAGKRKWVWYQESDAYTDDFAACGRAFERKHPGAVKKGRIGKAPSRLVDFVALVDFASEWFEATRNRE